MTHWPRTVERIVSLKAQEQIDEILLLAMKNVLHQDEELLRAKGYMKHRMNEHAQARQAGCSCDLCSSYERIRNLSSLIQGLTTYRRHEHRDWAADRQFLRNVNGKLLQEHNVRRRLMGLPKKHFIRRGTSFHS